MIPPIAILGAGPSGLLLGRLLEVANIDYIVFERDVTPASGGGSGGTLDIHTGSGQLALQEAGLFDQFQKLARFDGSTRIADYQGKILADLGADGNNDRPEIDRKDLRALLLNSIPAKRIQWGRRVEKVAKQKDGSISIHFTDGSFEKGFKLVVGADGAWSKVRSLLTSAKPQYSGYHYLTSHIHPTNPLYPSAIALAGRGNYMAFGNNQQLSVMYLGNGSYHIGMGLLLPGNWGQSYPLPERLVQMQGFCTGWPEKEREIIMNADEEYRAWPLYAMPTESLSWDSVPGVTVIGDAAHVTTPFEGEGVNCALFDSLQLAQKIHKYGLENLDQAVKEYEKEMFPRAIGLIERSAMNGELLYADDAPKRFLETIGIEC